VELNIGQYVGNNYKKSKDKISKISCGDFQMTFDLSTVLSINVEISI
jgi:hypothetical protein